MTNEGYRVMISVDGSVQLLGGFLDPKSLSYDKWYIDIGYDIQLEHSEDAASEEVATPGQPIQHNLTAELSLSVGSDARVPVGNLVRYMAERTMDLESTFAEDIYITGFYIDIENYAYDALEPNLPACFENLLAVAAGCYGDLETSPNSVFAFSDPNAGFTSIHLHFESLDGGIDPYAVMDAVNTVFVPLT